MRTRNLAALLSGGILVFLAILAISLKRNRPAAMEAKGSSLDWMAGIYGLIDRTIGLPFRQLTVQLAGIKEGDSVLDVGCGIGTLTLLEKEKAGRRGRAAGIDIAPRMIARARNQSARRGLTVDFRVASIDSLPFSSNTFDVVTSSLMVHHLPTDIKQAGFREVHRVLKPGGRYLVVDFPPARGLVGKIGLAMEKALSSLIQELAYSLDLAEGRVMPMLMEAGFAEVKEVERYRLSGIVPVSFISAVKRV